MSSDFPLNCRYCKEYETSNFIDHDRHEKNCKERVLFKNRIYVKLSEHQIDLAREAINRYYLGTKECRVMFGGKMIFDPKIPKDIAEKLTEAHFALYRILDTEIEIELDISTGIFKVKQ